MNSEKAALPIVYSCSGGSYEAQLANDLAVVLDREGHAQMSSITGVGCDIGGFVTMAKSGRPILAIDGCKIACVQKILAQHQISPRWHLDLSRISLKKNAGISGEFSDMKKILLSVYQLIATDKSQSDENMLCAAAEAKHE